MNEFDPKNPHNILLKDSDIAKRWSVSERTVRNKRLLGLIKFINLGNKSKIIPRIRYSDLLEYEKKIENKN